MLTQDRRQKILDYILKNGSAAVVELSEKFDTSESTIRRDLVVLSNLGKLNKVHGGATVLSQEFLKNEDNVEQKFSKNIDEKALIAKYAASQVNDDDFVFIDAGTTTEKMIDFLPDKKVTFVTNAFLHAKKLAQRGFKVYIPAGEIKLTTEAIVGAECVNSLKGYNFTKSFIGANAISLTAGISTPDRNEASVKSAVVQNSQRVYILSDHSKFGQIASVTFAQLGQVKIITDKLTDKKFLTKASIKEVM